jgi:hypothetical protein
MEHYQRDPKVEYQGVTPVYDYSNYQPVYPSLPQVPQNRYYQADLPLNQQSSYSRDPEKVVCPVCKNLVTTRVVHTRGVTAWVLCIILCLFCFPFCIYPLICTPCLDTRHVCPHCENELASIPIV